MKVGTFLGVGVQSEASDTKREGGKNKSIGNESDDDPEVLPSARPQRVLTKIPQNVGESQKVFHILTHSAN